MSKFDVAVSKYSEKYNIIVSKEWLGVHLRMTKTPKLDCGRGATAEKTHNLSLIMREVVR